MICISVSDISQLDPLIEAGAEFLELRLDLIGKHPNELFSRIPAIVKSIVTCREGAYNENDRLILLKDAIQMGAAYVDIELESKKEFAREILDCTEETACEVIFSHHDFEGTPAEEVLLEKMKACYERGGAVAKIACQVKSTEDILTLFSLYRQPGRKVILGMGPEGRITRVAAPVLGSEFTFASPSEGGETAPGQMSAGQLNAIYKILKGS